MKKLNLGCGQDIKKGYVNLDKRKLHGVDVIWDINKQPLPFKNNEFDEIYADNVLEHTEDVVSTVNELWRITKGGGLIKLVLPSWNAADAYTDPTHKHFFTLDSFDYWDKKTGKGKQFGHEVSKKEEFDIVKKKLIFNRFYRAIGIQFLANKFYKIYKHIFCWILPAIGLHFELRVLK